MYSKTYMKHFTNPQNIGKIENADAKVEVINEDPGCFDKVNFFVKFENGKIADAKYQLKACSGTIMAFSLLSELVIGKTLDEIELINFDSMQKIIGELPEKKHHSLQLAIKAKDEVIKILKNGGGAVMPKITKDMSITEILQKYPETQAVFANYELGCLGCIAARFETLEDGLNVHGIEVEGVVEALNKVVEEN